MSLIIIVVSDYRPLTYIFHYPPNIGSVGSTDKFGRNASFWDVPMMDKVGMISCYHGGTSDEMKQYTDAMVAAISAAINVFSFFLINVLSITLAKKIMPKCYKANGCIDCLGTTVMVIVWVCVTFVTYFTGSNSCSDKTDCPWTCDWEIKEAQAFNSSLWTWGKNLITTERIFFFKDVAFAHYPCCTLVNGLSHLALAS